MNQPRYLIFLLPPLFINFVFLFAPALLFLVLVLAFLFLFHMGGGIKRNGDAKLKEKNRKTLKQKNDDQK